MEYCDTNLQCQRLKNAFYMLCRTWRRKTVRCPHCVDSMDLLTFQTVHVLEVHGIDPSLQCPFCVDNVCWPRGDKTKLVNLTHLHACLRNFLDIQKRSSKAISRIVEREALEEEVTELCECVHFKSSDHALQMDMRTRVYEYARSGFYDPGILENPNLLRRNNGRISFQEDCGLGWEVAELHHMFRGRRWTFYHIMVRGYAFQKFVEVFTPMRDTVFVAPFWCLCDAYKCEDEMFLDADRQHRHMILATCNRRTFLKAWVYKLKVAGRDFCKSSRLIEDELHLFNAIRYVSQKKSSCNGVFISDELLSGAPSHFCIGRPLYPHCLLAMCAMSETGFQKMIANRNKLKKMDERWVDSVEHYRTGQCNLKYRVPMRVTDVNIRNCCIPVRKDLEPTTDASSAAITLHMLNKCMHFKVNDRLASMEDVDWFRYVASRGNVLLNYVDECWYDLGHTQTYVMNMLVRIRDEFNARMAMHEQSTSRMLNKVREEAKLEAERIRNEAKLEAERLRNEAKLELSEREIERLRNESSRLERENERLRNESTRLEREIERLRYESVKRENERLENELVSSKRDFRREIKNLTSVSKKRKLSH